MLVKFADDITVSHPVTDGVDHVSAEVNNILKCSKHNSMTLNLDKTMEMVVKRWKTSARLFLLQSAAEAC